MNHKCAAGEAVCDRPAFGNTASRGKYKMVRVLPFENDNRLSCRIKSLAGTFERIAGERQLSCGG